MLFRSAEEAKGIVDTHISDQEIRRADEVKKAEEFKAEQERVAGEWNNLFADKGVKFDELTPTQQGKFRSLVSNKVGDTYEPISEHLGVDTVTGETTAPSAEAYKIFDRVTSEKTKAAKKAEQPTEADQARAQVQNIYNAHAEEHGLPKFDELTPDNQTEVYKTYEDVAGGRKSLTAKQAKDIATKQPKPEVIEEPTVKTPPVAETPAALEPDKHGDTSVYDTGVTPPSIPEKRTPPETTAPEDKASVLGDIKATASSIRKQLEAKFSLSDYLNQNKVTNAGIEGVTASNVKETLLDRYAAEHEANIAIDAIAKGEAFDKLSKDKQDKIRAITAAQDKYTAAYNRDSNLYGDTAWFKELDKQIGKAVKAHEKTKTKPAGAPEYVWKDYDLEQLKAHKIGRAHV